MASKDTRRVSQVNISKIYWCITSFRIPSDVIHNNVLCHSLTFRECSVTLAHLNIRVHKWPWKALPHSVVINHLSELQLLRQAISLLQKACSVSFVKFAPNRFWARITKALAPRKRLCVGNVFHLQKIVKQLFLLIYRGFCNRTPDAQFDSPLFKSKYAMPNFALWFFPRSQLRASTSQKSHQIWYPPLPMST